MALPTKTVLRVESAITLLNIPPLVFSAKALAEEEFAIFLTGYYTCYCLCPKFELVDILDLGIFECVANPLIEAPPILGVPAALILVE